MIQKLKYLEEGPKQRIQRLLGMLMILMETVGLVPGLPQLKTLLMLGTQQQQQLR